MPTGWPRCPLTSTTSPFPIWQSQVFFYNYLFALYLILPFYTWEGFQSLYMALILTEDLGIDAQPIDGGS